MRFFSLLTICAFLLGPAACDVFTSQKEKFVRVCLDGGDSRFICECVYDEMAKHLTRSQMKTLTDEYVRTEDLGIAILRLGPINPERNPYAFALLRAVEACILGGNKNVESAHAGDGRPGNLEQAVKSLRGQP